MWNHSLSLTWYTTSAHRINSSSCPHILPSSTSVANLERCLFEGFNFYFLKLYDSYLILYNTLYIVNDFFMCNIYVYI